MKNKLYILIMHRWGEKGLHSYTQGVYDDKELALKVGRAEMLYRAGKYEPKLYEAEINKPYYPNDSEFRAILGIGPEHENEDTSFDETYSENGHKKRAIPGRGDNQE